MNSGLPVSPFPTRADPGPDVAPGADVGASVVVAAAVDLADGGDFSSGDSSSLLAKVVVLVVVV